MSTAPQPLRLIVLIALLGLVAALGCTADATKDDEPSDSASTEVTADGIEPEDSAQPSDTDSPDETADLDDVEVPGVSQEAFDMLAERVQVLEDGTAVRDADLAALRADLDTVRADLDLLRTQRGKVVIGTPPAETFARDEYQDIGVEVVLEPGTYVIGYEVPVDVRISGTATNVSTSVTVGIRDLNNSVIALSESSAAHALFSANHGPGFLTISKTLPELELSLPTTLKLSTRNGYSGTAGTTGYTVRANAYLWYARVR